ncbi:hypothetical protein NLI96_g11952 [Meripilus lineatus]|uniref:Ribonuclease H1 N-terminal domain-containing protein n=1 Tax=Meripilus lineatus TaxID=2056292 RepID=A0AAD5UQX9_9APHY|nr:hypothetical protein NLI96_g11952 [Physisporinus lineatus]
MRNHNVVKVYKGAILVDGELYWDSREPQNEARDLDLLVSELEQTRIDKIQPEALSPVSIQRGRQLTIKPRIASRPSDSGKWPYERKASFKRDEVGSSDDSDSSSSTVKPLNRKPEGPTSLPGNKGYEPLHVVEPSRLRPQVIRPSASYGLLSRWDTAAYGIRGAYVSKPNSGQPPSPSVLRGPRPPKDGWLYVVTAGTATGIFHTYTEVKARTYGIPGAIYKAYPSRSEAELAYQYVERIGALKVINPNRSKSSLPILWTLPNRLTTSCNKKTLYKHPRQQAIPSSLHHRLEFLMTGKSFF